MDKRLLIAYAHPDDESFGIGAVIAKYSAESVATTLICATNGDVGSVAPEKMNGFESVAALRSAELDCAAQALGLSEVIRFNYRDSGMMHSADNADPRSLWQAPRGEVTERIIEVMRRTRPQVVITFDPYGAYGHPDHIKIHQATLAAFAALHNQPNAPQKLYYAALPRFWLRIGVGAIKLFRRNPRQMGTNRDMDLQAMADEALPAHTRVDVGRYYVAGQRAAACHASQSSGMPSFPGAGWLLPRLMRYASFTRAEPPGVVGQPLETDLFAGLPD